MRVFLNAQDLPCRSWSAVPVLLAILAVSEVTSGAALTSVADLEAAPEVTKTDWFTTKYGTLAYRPLVRCVC